MQAIVTKFHGPTNTRGSRYSASTESGHRISLPADYSLDARDNHERAARALMKKLGWTGKIAGGGVKGGYVWVFAEGARDPGPRRGHLHRRAGAPTFAQQKKISAKMRILERENDRRRPRRSQAQMLAIAYRYAGVPPRSGSRLRAAGRTKKRRA